MLSHSVGSLLLLLLWESNKNNNKNAGGYSSKSLSRDSWESMDCKKIQPVHPKEISPEYSLEGRVEAETPILWPPDVKNWLIGKGPDAQKDWRREERGTTQDERVGWHHRLSRHGFGWTPGGGDGQWGLACCRPCGHKEDTTERLNWTELFQK